MTGLFALCNVSTTRCIRDMFTTFRTLGASWRTVSGQMTGCGSCSGELHPAPGTFRDCHHFPHSRRFMANSQRADDRWWQLLRGDPSSPRHPKRLSPLSHSRRFMANSQRADDRWWQLLRGDPSSPRHPKRLLFLF
ncbi:uncharacterized protein [Haliotis asinina]|uniref:uncharacterized protein n=1 Tax=Haliotis asinina TaxID=109174 RepID=UPI003531AAEC